MLHLDKLRSTVFEFFHANSTSPSGKYLSVMVSEIEKLHGRDSSKNSFVL